MRLTISILMIAIPVAVGFLPAPNLEAVRLFALCAGLSIGMGACGVAFHFLKS